MTSVLASSLGANNAQRGWWILRTWGHLPYSTEIIVEDISRAQEADSPRNVRTRYTLEAVSQRDGISFFGSREAGAPSQMIIQWLYALILMLWKSNCNFRKFRIHQDPTISFENPQHELAHARFRVGVGNPIKKGSEKLPRQDVFSFSQVPKLHLFGDGVTTTPLLNRPLFALNSMAKIGPRKMGL